ADCVRQRRPVIHNDYPTLANRKGMPKGHVPVIREMVVPVFRGGRIVAIVGVGNKPVDYTDADVQILSLLGDFSWEIVIRKRVEEELATREREFRMVVENSPDCIVRFDTEGRFAYVNPRWEQIMGLSADTVLGRLLSEAMVSEEAARYAQKLRKVIKTGRDDEIDILFPHADKGERHHNIRLVAERGGTGEITGVLAMGRDITEIKSYQERLQNLAFFDPLTRLPNRENFNLRLEQTLAETKRAEKNTVVGVMFLDLDDFKTVNDILGHDMGDRLLCKVGERLCDSVRNYDLVARLGGDEFALILPDFRQGIDLSVVARKILAAIKDPFYIDGKELFISASFRFYSESMTRQATDRLELEVDLRKALQLDQFELYFQPKVNTLVGLVVGSEALLRWRHPARGLVTPDLFIGIAEDTGLIVEIGVWVLEQACRAAVAWNQAAPYPLKVAVNLSVRQFLVGDIAQTVQAVLSRTGCRPDWLELEITESLLMANRTTIIGSLETLTKLGINVGIDDFGTGYSSLSYLTRFPVSTLKIDRLFIQEMTSEKKHLELVKAIVSMGLALGLELVAEGVEDAEQAACLDKFGCHIVQGYFYGRPMPLEGFNNWWSEFYRHRSWEKESQGESTPLLWRDYLTTGHELIDAQHRELFRRIAQLSVLYRDKMEAEEILQLLDFLSDYVGSHFAVEEELLRSLNSPRFQAHKAEHVYFANVVDKLVSLYREGGATASLVLETHCVAVNWLTRHICSMDRELADSLLNPV
ncbi:MAG: bacteriohemerythrin, partial [Desulfuromonadaceae bacterium]